MNLKGYKNLKHVFFLPAPFHLLCVLESQLHLVTLTQNCSAARLHEPAALGDPQSWEKQKNDRSSLLMSVAELMMFKASTMTRNSHLHTR